MKLFKNTRLILFILVSFPFSISSQNNLNDPSLNGKNIIYVYGGMNGHSPKESVNLFVPILEKEGASVKVFDNFSVYEDQKLMNEARYIYFWRSIRGNNSFNLVEKDANGPLF